MDTKTRVLSTIEAMTSAFHQGDIEGIMRTYEPVAVVVGQPGAPCREMVPCARCSPASFRPPNSSEADLVNAVVSTPDDTEAWRALISHLENLPSGARNIVLMSIGADLVVRLHQLDDVHFGRLMTLLCEWAEGTAFDWAYCDVVGDRLLEAHRVAPVRIKCRIVMAALELAVSHNRWHVMNQVGAMLSPVAD